MAPEIVTWVLDKFDKGDQESPRVWPVHNEPLEQDSGYLFLDLLCLAFCEQVQQNTAEVVSVAVGIAQLIGNRVQEHIAAYIYRSATATLIPCTIRLTFRVQFCQEMLIDFHRRTLVDRNSPRYTRVADVEDERVHQRHIVL